MEAQKWQRCQKYCRFTAVFDFLLLFVLSGAAAFAFGVWMGLEIFLFFPSGTYVFLTTLLTLLWLLLIVGIVCGGLYGIWLLWREKEQGKRKYMVFLILSIVLGVAGIAAGILFAVGGILNVAADVCAGVMALIFAVLNGAAFYLKMKEPAREQAEESTRGTMKEPAGKSAGTPEKETNGNLLGIKGEYAGAVFPIRDREQIVLGKDSEKCQILFSDPHISRVHLCIRYLGDSELYEVTDYSRNGTYDAQGERLPSQVTCRFRRGMIFTLNHEKEVFRLL